MSHGEVRQVAWTHAGKRRALRGNASPTLWTRDGRRPSDLPEPGRLVLGCVHDAPRTEIATSLASQGPGRPSSWPPSGTEIPG